MNCDILPYSEFDRFHRDYYLRNRPVVLRGMRDVGPLAIYEWSPDYLARAMGDKTVPVLKTATGFLSYERDVDAMPFSEFIARSFGELRDPRVRYYFKNSTALLPPGLDDSDRLERFVPYTSKAVLRNLWISGPGLTVGLHFDAAENFNFQLRGRKLFTLFPPGVRAFYPMPMFSQTAHISRVFRNGPTLDRAAFPRFDPAMGIPIELQAGDTLYLPAYWWHQVESLGDENLNLNFWWVPSPRKQVPNWNQALRGHVQLALRYLKFGSIEKAPERTPRAEMDAKRSP